jgi:hypothetical protein
MQAYNALSEPFGFDPSLEVDDDEFVAAEQNLGENNEDDGDEA